MASPWICSSCRTRLPSIVKGARSISQHAARQESIGEVQERHRGGIQQNEAVNVGGSVRGRYSGRQIPTQTLRPETVLHELEKDNDNDRWGKAKGENGRRRTRQRQREAPHESNAERSFGREGAVHPRQAKLPPLLIRETDAFIDAVTAGHLAHAWQLLDSKIAPKLHQIAFPHRRDWMRKALVQPQLHKFQRVCTSQWLNALQNGTLSDHTLPNPYQITLLIENLGFGKSVFYRPLLWQLAAGINDIRFDHPNVDLRPGVEEVMKLWRLCNLVAVTRNRANHHRDALTTHLDSPHDWSFLPPPTVFALSSTRRHFNDLLETIIIAEVKSSDDGAEGKFDYAAPALATLDLLRTTQCKMEDGSVGVWSELPEYMPWVKLMETLLKSVTPSQVPVSFRQKLVGDNDELRERYWRLLRRVGIKAEVVEAEARRRVYRPRVVEEKKSPSGLTVDPASPAQGSSTPKPAALHTSEDVEKKPPSLENVPRPTPHIKFAIPPTNPVVEQFALQTITRLGRALDKSDIHQAEHIRRNISAFSSSNDLAPTALPIEVYEHLMMVLFALKNQQSAVEVWRKFTTDGYIPTVRTYTVLMRGASRAHDVTTVEKFWHAMRHQAHLQPDAHAWSTRIDAIFIAKLSQKGLAALSEMGKEWYTAARNAEYEAAGVPLPQKEKSKKASASNFPEPSLQDLLVKYRGSVNGVPRPGLVTMNAAIAALASSQHREEIPKVLHWGRTFSIEPDLITYNALLNICMRHSRGDEALSILSRMQAKGIQANSTTWTVLLTALFQSGFIEDLTPEAQSEKIMSFIRSVSSPQEDGESGKGTGGLDNKGYALIIDRLLKHHSNAPAAAEVLSYMVSTAGLRPTAQIYTILMTSYFFPPSGGSPDWNAIDTLWSQISTPDHKGYTPPLDPIFYDRMVEGYALHHETVGMKPAMDFLARMSEKGMKPGFGALEAVARMLAQREEWVVLGRLVGEVRKRGRSGVVHQRQREFWEFVVGTGILREEGIVEVGQVFEEGRGRGHWMDRGR